MRVRTIAPTSSLHVGTRFASGRLLALVEPKDGVKVVETILLAVIGLVFSPIPLPSPGTQYLQKSHHRTIWRMWWTNNEDDNKIPSTNHNVLEAEGLIVGPPTPDRTSRQVGINPWGVAIGKALLWPWLRAAAGSIEAHYWLVGSRVRRVTRRSVNDEWTVFQRNGMFCRILVCLDSRLHLEQLAGFYVRTRRSGSNIAHLIELWVRTALLVLYYSRAVVVKLTDTVPRTVFNTWLREVAKYTKFGLTRWAIQIFWQPKLAHAWVRRLREQDTYRRAQARCSLSSLLQPSY